MPKRRRLEVREHREDDPHCDLVLVVNSEEESLRRDTSLLSCSDSALRLGDMLGLQVLHVQMQKSNSGYRPIRSSVLRG